MAIKAITIDFWNTLYNSANGQARARDRAVVIRSELTRLGVAATDQELEQAQARAWEHFNRVWLQEQRTLLTADLVKFYLKQLHTIGDEQALDAICRTFADGILRHPPEPLGGAQHVIGDLARLYPLSLISDTAFSPGRVLKQVMDQHGLAQHFHSYSFSDETGVSKPHPQAFHTVLQAMNISPAECVHIGDIEHTDIKGAKELGMRAILFRGDSNSMVDQGDERSTQADAIARDWHEVRTILDGMA